MRDDAVPELTRFICGKHFALQLSASSAKLMDELLTAASHSDRIVPDALRYEASASRVANQINSEPLRPLSKQSYIFSSQRKSSHPPACTPLSLTLAPNTVREQLNIRHSSYFVLPRPF